MPSRARVHDVLRVAAALLAVVAITYQLARLQGHPSFREAGNFFSFFTIQSNLIAAAALVLAAVVRRDQRSLGFDAARTAGTFHIAITGVVFAALVSGRLARARRLGRPVPVSVRRRPEHGYARVAVNGIVFLVAFAVGALALARVAAGRTGRPEPVAVPSAQAGG